jgi:hypothetical protein
VKKCHLAEPKIAAGVSETDEVKLLRALRACELDFCRDVILRGGIKGRVPRFVFVGRGTLISPATVATAFHEAGHAVVGFKLSGNVPLKISVIPEAGSLGRTHNPSAKIVPA